MQPLEVPAYLAGLWGGAGISVLGAYLGSTLLAAAGVVIAAGTLIYELVALFSPEVG